MRPSTSSTPKLNQIRRALDEPAATASSRAFSRGSVAPSGRARRSEGGVRRRVVDCAADQAAPAYAQDADLKSSQAPPAPTASDKDGVDAGDVAQFLLGGALGLGLHESGHVIAGAAFGANPGIKGILRLHPVLRHHARSRVAGAGIHDLCRGLLGAVADERMAADAPPQPARRARPDREGRPRIHVLASADYGVAGMAHIGPPESDTRGDGRALRVNEAWVGPR